MNPNLRKLIVPAVLLGVLLIVVAVIYFADSAHSLPSFFPGHVSSTSSEANHHHTKHGIAALLGMLNTCSPSVSVVNIDNGFGAACIASLINRL